MRFQAKATSLGYTVFWKLFEDTRPAEKRSEIQSGNRQFDFNEQSMLYNDVVKILLQRKSSKDSARTLQAVI